MIEKQGIINEENTPVENLEDDLRPEYDLSKLVPTHSSVKGRRIKMGAPTEQLEDHITKRTADAVADKLKNC